MDDMTKKQRRRNMQRIRSKDTKAEVMLRKALWKKGYRYRKNWGKLPGCPDIALTKQKICIFVDGEYFHGKDWEAGRKEKVSAGNNASYWVPKIEKNMDRDRSADAELNGLGWTVLRFWSRDVVKNVDACVNAIDEAYFNRMVCS